MPREREAIISDTEPVENEILAKSVEKVYGEDNLDSEDMEEEIEYEEVEVVEEIEVEEEVEVEEDVEEEEEEQKEVAYTHIANGDIARHSIKADGTKLEIEDYKEMLNKLLALPPHGSQVYVGGIPNDLSEEDLKAFCEPIGEVAELRIMKDKDSDVNKGFGFVTFRSVELASKAIEQLNNTDLKGKQIKCSKSQAKNRLFINNIPRQWGEDDLKEVLEDVGPGMTALQLVKDVKSPGNNRGFAFVDYYNSACADYSRQRMISPTFKLGTNTPTVSWADPKNADSSTSLQVKTIYVKNLPENITQDQLKNLFECHGIITKVVIPPKKAGREKNRIGFIHFAERSDALKALMNTEKYELDGRVLECSLAKPWADQKPVSRLNLQMAGLLPSYPPLVGHGLVGSAYGAIGAGYGASSFAQPLVYGNVLPPEMTMMPLVLPDGQIGYILQQPGLHSHIPDSMQRSFGSSSRGGFRSDGASSNRQSHDNIRGGRYRPY